MDELNAHSILPCGTFRGVFSGTFSWPRGVAVFHQRCEAQLNFFRACLLLVLNETTLLKVFLTLFFLCRGEVGNICDVTFFTIGVFASHNVIIFSFLDDYYLIDTTFPCGSN